MPKFDLKFSHQTKYIFIFWISIFFNQESDTVILDMLFKTCMLCLRKYVNRRERTLGESTVWDEKIYSVRIEQKELAAL